MFTGIVESVGIIKHIASEYNNKHFQIQSYLSGELKINQSIAHNGVCLTVVDIENDRYTVTAIHETLNKTTLNNWRIDDEINLERCLRLDGRLDGHIVQGHVDTIAECQSIENQNGSWLFHFKLNNKNNNSLMINKGSISINGTSLTIIEAKEDRFCVAIIPYTYEHTNFKKLKKGDWVNIEFDMIGKYIYKLTQAYC